MGHLNMHKNLGVSYVVNPTSFNQCLVYLLLIAMSLFWMIDYFVNNISALAVLRV